jgi:hypothetical protein
MIWNTGEKIKSPKSEVVCRHTIHTYSFTFNNLLLEKF